MLEGNLTIHKNAQGMVIFAHGSGSSSRHSRRNRYVAKALQNRCIATLIIDLLTANEEEIEIQTRYLRFDIKLLAERLTGATNWWLEKQVKEGQKKKK